MSHKRRKRKRTIKTVVVSYRSNRENSKRKYTKSNDELNAKEDVHTPTLKEKGVVFTRSLKEPEKEKGTRNEGKTNAKISIYYLVQ